MKNIENAPFSVGLTVYHIKEFKITEFIVFKQSNNFFMDILGNRYSKKKCFSEKKYAEFEVYKNIKRLLNDNKLTFEMIDSIREKYNEYNKTTKQIT